MLEWCAYSVPASDISIMVSNDYENGNTLAIINENENENDVDFQNENNIKIKMMSYKTYKTRKFLKKTKK